MMRVVFMGSPLAAVPSLDRLLQSRHEVVAVVTQPDRPFGRGQQLRPTPVRQLALEHGVTTYAPDNLVKTEFHETLAAHNPDVLVVVAYGKILRPAMLEVPRLGCVNVHFSLLPKYRGAAPVQWALIDGERNTGVTIMKLDAGMDTGDILAQREQDILEDDDVESLTNALAVLGADALIETLDRIERAGAIEGSPQDHAGATEAPMLDKEAGHLDFTQPVETIMFRLRGTTPWPGAHFYVGDKMWGLRQAEPLPANEAPPEPEEGAVPGQIVGVLKGFGAIVRAGDGNLLLTRVQPPGKREMGGYDACNGGLLKVGQRLM